MNEWQPIETAPKTTKSRLVWCPKYQNTYVVSWWGDVWVHFGGSGGSLRETPSHWMQLPDPPSPHLTNEPAPDATGGVPSEVFVRELRDGWR